MKITNLKESVRLIPENDEEIKALNRIRKYVIKEIHLEDDDDLNGNLLIDFDFDWDV
jgi:hypothetical protein